MLSWLNFCDAFVKDDVSNVVPCWSLQARDCVLVSIDPVQISKTQDEYLHRNLTSPGRLSHTRSCVQREKSHIRPDERRCNKVVMKKQHARIVIVGGVLSRDMRSLWTTGGLLL